MKQRTEQEDLMVRYLLGELTEEEQSEVENKFLIDNDYFERLCSVEDALIDDYTQGVLSNVEREKVESLLLSSRYEKQEVDFVRDLIDGISSGPSGDLNTPSPSQTIHSSKIKSLLLLLGMQGGLKQVSIAILLLVTVIVVLLTIWNLRLQSKIEQMQSNQREMEKREQVLQEAIEWQSGTTAELSKQLEDERNKRYQLEEEIETLQESNPALPQGSVAIINLSPGSFSRGSGELPVINIRPGISNLQVRIELDRADRYKSYSAAIETFDGRKVWSKDRVRLGQSNLDRMVLTVPTDLLANEDYTLTLKGETETGEKVEIGDYSFRVKR